MATQEEVNPHVKEHNGVKICFADTLVQANTALAERQTPGATPSKDLAESSHLMLFGVENWGNGTELKEFAKQLSGTKFERVEIFGSTLSDEHQLELAKGIQNEFWGNVKKFDLDNTELSAQGAKAIMTQLADRNCTVEELNLQGSVKNAEVLKAIMDALRTNASLRKIDLKINDIKGGSAKCIAEFLKAFAPNEKFELDLFYNDLQAAGAITIAQALATSSCMLTHLDLCCNGIGDAGAEAIAKALKTNTALRSLKLALNNIGNKGAMALFRALYAQKDKEKQDAFPGVNYSLRLLDLSANVMKEPNDDEERALSKELMNVIKRGYGLQDFDFTGIELGDAGWDSIGDALMDNGPQNSNFKGVLAELTGQTMSPDDPVQHIPTVGDRTIRFSIVDLMSQERLKKMEGKIWGTKQQQYDWVDWRRRDPPPSNDQNN